MARRLDSITAEQATSLAFFGLLALVAVVDGLLGFVRGATVFPPDRSGGLLYRLVAGVITALPFGGDALQWLLALLALGAVVAAILRASLVSPRYAAVALVALPAVFVYATTGFVLQWDQFGFQLAQSLLEVTLAAPVLGRPLAGLAFGGVTLNQTTLVRAFIVHYGLLVAGVLVAVVFLFRYGRENV